MKSYTIEGTNHKWKFFEKCGEIRVFAGCFDGSIQKMVDKIYTEKKIMTRLNILRRVSLETGWEIPEPYFDGYGKCKGSSIDGSCYNYDGNGYEHSNDNGCGKGYGLGKGEDDGKGKGYGKGYGDGSGNGYGVGNGEGYGYEKIYYDCQDN